MGNKNKTKLVCGVGVNDADYVVQKRIRIEIDGVIKNTKIVCPFYRTWSSMLNRAYSAKYHKIRPTYVGCSVDESWHNFSNFKNWMQLQDWEDKHLDKDILYEGNKIYSQSTCVFVDSSVNNFLNDHRASRGKYPIGVSFHKQNRRYIATISDPFAKKTIHLGVFNSPEEAHSAWLEKKRIFSIQLASQQTDHRVAAAIIARYANYTILED